MTKQQLHLLQPTAEQTTTITMSGNDHHHAMQQNKVTTQAAPIPHGPANGEKQA